MSRHCLQGLPRPQHHSPLGATAAVADAWLCPGPRPTGQPAGLLNLLSETRPGSGASRRGGSHTDAQRPGAAGTETAVGALLFPPTWLGGQSGFTASPARTEANARSPLSPVPGPRRREQQHIQGRAGLLPRTLPLPLPNAHGEVARDSRSQPSPGGGGLSALPQTPGSAREAAGVGSPSQRRAQRFTRFLSF